MATNTDYLDAQDKINKKVGQLGALLSLIITTENKCFEGVRDLTKENIFYLAGGLADDISEAVTVIYHGAPSSQLEHKNIEALCFKSNHLCALLDVINTHFEFAYFSRGVLALTGRKPAPARIVGAIPTGWGG